MFNFKKLFLVALFGLSIPFTGLAKTLQTTHVSTTIQTTVQICDFDPQHDTQAVLRIFNENPHWLSSDDSSEYQYYLQECQHHPSCTIKVLKENDEVVGYIIYTNNGYIEQL